MFRFVLILLLVWLIYRVLKSAAAPKKDSRVRGNPPAKRVDISEDRIQDANFKDLPEDK